MLLWYLNHARRGLDGVAVAGAWTVGGEGLEAELPIHHALLLIEEVDVNGVEDEPHAKGCADRPFEVKNVECFWGCFLEPEAERLAQGIGESDDFHSSCRTVTLPYIVCWTVSPSKV